MDPNPPCAVVPKRRTLIRGCAHGRDGLGHAMTGPAASDKGPQMYGN